MSSENPSVGANEEGVVAVSISRIITASVVLFSILTTSCGKTSILLTLDGDLNPGVGVDSVDVSILTGGQLITTGHYRLEPDMDWPQTVEILPGATSGSILIRVEAHLSNQQTITVLRDTNFVEGIQVEERICLFSRCIGSDNIFCAQGACGTENTNDDADLDTDIDAETESDAELEPDGDTDPDGLPLCTSDRTECCQIPDPGLDPFTWEFSESAIYDSDNGYTILVPAQNWVRGQLWFAHPITQPFVARYRFRSPFDYNLSAEGQIFVFYAHRDYEPGIGGTIGFMEGFDACDTKQAGCGGFGFKVDHWQSSECEDFRHHFALVYDTTSNNLTDIVQDVRTIDGQWHDVVVTVEETTITIDLDGKQLIHWEGVIDRTHGTMGFISSTGGLNNEYVVDDIEIIVACPDEN